MNTAADPIIDTSKADAKAIAEYNVTEAALAALRKELEGVVFDLTKAEGNTAARAARKRLVTLRTSLEAKRKELKEPALDYSRRIDAEAKRITGEILKLEGPIDMQILADEQRREDEKNAKAQAEMLRIQGHQDAIATLRRIPPEASGATPETLEKHIQLLLAFDIGPAFEEFEEAARAARAETIGVLRELKRAAEARVAEEARIAADRAELERLRAAQAQRDAEEQARRDAEAARVAAEQQAERERQAAQQRELDAQAAAQRAEQERIAAEAADLQRRQREQAQRDEAERQRKAQEALDAAEREADARVARMHAAGPTMLAALELVQGTPEWPLLGMSTQSFIEIAISAATGKPTSMGNYYAADGSPVNADGTPLEK